MTVSIIFSIYLKPTTKKNAEYNNYYDVIHYEYNRMYINIIIMIVIESLTMIIILIVIMPYTIATSSLSCYKIVIIISML